MRLLFLTEARFSRQSNGGCYCPDRSFSYEMFGRYLKAFDEVFVLGRASGPGGVMGDKAVRVDGEGVQVLPLTYYVGPYQYLSKRKKVERSIRKYIDAHPGAAVICRVPGAIGNIGAKYLKSRKRKYGVELVGDPSDVFAPGSFKHPFRWIFRYSGVSNLKSVLKGAGACLYVTKKSLQARYPPARESFSTFASNVMLPAEAFVEKAKCLKGKARYSVVSVGSLDALYKAPDTVIEAVSILEERAFRLSIQWVGDGTYKSEMEKHARRVGVERDITFVGHVSTVASVRKYLDAADLFVLASRTEGLPRALIEAMARGLPCIGTAVGGIPELLDKVALVPINSPKLLADKIVSFLTEPGMADAQAKRNLIEAHSYESEVLDGRRSEFYNYLKGIS